MLSNYGPFSLLAALKVGPPILKKKLRNIVLFLVSEHLETLKFLAAKY